MLFFTEELLPEFHREQFEYEKDEEIYEIIIKRYLTEVEDLIRRGISKGYIEVEENLPTVRQRILIADTITKNHLRKDRMFCRFSDFTSDVPENRVVKYTLHLLSTMNFDDSSITRTSRRLLRYFDNISFSILRPGNFPRIQYTRLNEHYKTIVKLSELIVDHTALNLATTGEVRFSSFLVDMNKLFQQFLLSYLRQALRDYNVKGEPSYTFGEERKKPIYPDIVIRQSGVDLLVLDAKYKRNTDDQEERKAIPPADFFQMHSYAVTLGLPYGVLVYPKHELSEDYEEKYTIRGVTLLIKRIDLSKEGTDFTAECDRFVEEISNLIEQRVMPMIPKLHS
jgi:5-methylcytosine-specific restriction enzyme subunit McrC